jgi:uncharacterized protein (TIGR03435 family)
MHRLALLAALLALAAPAAIGQANAAPSTPVPQNASQAQPQTAKQPAKPIEFDVVSIKPNNSGSPAMIDQTPPDGYTVENMIPRYVISSAYGIRADLITGSPGWIDSKHYDIQAKVAGSDLSEYHKLSKQQRGRMLQSMLADRFKLTAHTETKELPGYELIVAKSGSKLQQSPSEPQMGWGANFGDIKANAMPVATLADILSNFIHQTVTDKTGLTGKYDFELKWADDRAARRPSQAAEGNSEALAPDPSEGPSLFTAVQEQLGLKLQPTKVPVETLVIDHVEPPSPN